MPGGRARRYSTPGCRLGWPGSRPHRRLPGRREGQPTGQPGPQTLRVVRTIQSRRRRPQGRQFPRLTAEGEHVHHPRGGQQTPRPRAKDSAEAMAQGVGSSSTRSAPPERARAARLHLSVRAHSPRWTQWPLMTHITAVSAPRVRRVRAMCQACPRWKGLYSATIPAVAMG